MNVRVAGGRAFVIAVAALSCAPAEKGPPVKSARGNEPFWAVAFEGPGATFRSPEKLDGIVYKEGQWKRMGDSTWVFKARRETAEGLWIELELTKAPCTDSMSGQAFPYQAVVTFEDKRMQGCAS